MTLATQQDTAFDFRTAASHYREAVDAWALAADALRDAQARLRAAQQALGDEEMGIRLDPNIDGKNAETREAQFRSLALGEQGYMDALAEVEAAKRDVQRWTDAATTERDKMSGQKRVMDFCTAWIRFCAVEGGENGDH